MKNAIKLFNNKEIRVLWNEDEEKWYFSIVDVVEVLTESPRPRKYWNDLKKKLEEEGSELSDKIGQLKLQSSDGKYYLTDVADTEQLLRLIQSVPSKKAEPFKIWLAKVGRERIDEIQDPELSINRALSTYLKKGYSKEWVNQRLKTIEIRKELTDEWNRVGIKNQGDYAILTNEITKAWSGKSVKDYKKLKNLKKENLRDNMTNLELVLNMLAEVTTKEISKNKDPTGFDESKKIAKRGGRIAGKARIETEKEIGRKVISSKNAEDIHFKNKKKLK
ncbi:Bro-N domain-containing protein [Candidatus Woesearchaeota archaeon]|nr:Bro-N domain-containing protein [Candidatus Woesearchaeota archaeon]